MIAGRQLSFKFKSNFYILAVQTLSWRNPRPTIRNSAYTPLYLQWLAHCLTARIHSRSIHPTFKLLPAERFGDFEAPRSADVYTAELPLSRNERNFFHLSLSSPNASLTAPASRSHPQTNFPSPLRLSLARAREHYPSTMTASHTLRMLVGAVVLLLVSIFQYIKGRKSQVSEAKLGVHFLSRHRPASSDKRPRHRCNRNHRVLPDGVEVCHRCTKHAARRVLQGVCAAPFAVSCPGGFTCAFVVPLSRIQDPTYERLVCRPQWTGIGGRTAGGTGRRIRSGRRHG